MVDFTWKIGGPAGFGIMTTGLIFSKAFSRCSYFVFDYTEFPSLIRGGRNTYQCRISSEEIFSQNKPVHILVALNKETIDVNRNEVVEKGVIIYDSDKINDDVEKGFGVPLAKLAKHSGGKELMANNVALGASIALIDYDLESLNAVITDIFKSKGSEIVSANINSAKAGYDYVKENYNKKFSVVAKKIEGKNRYLATGNEALGAGSIVAGTKFYAGYPMTPTSTLLTYMAQRQDKFNFVVKQCHDEIAVVNTAVGAAFAGVRSMVATAGGGFALMSEGYGLAAMTETPLVIVVGQRPGPATGLPTWSSQADLRFVMHAHQDDFPRIVIAPGDQEECYSKVQEAHNIADRYQTPVILLTDKYLAESHKTIEFPEDAKIDRGDIITEIHGEYLRYKFTETGISPRVLPGTKGAVVVANSDEHQESGQSTEESEMRNRMVEKRMKKLEEFKKETPGPTVYGSENADVTIVGFGSVKGPVLEAMKLLAKENIKLNFIHFVYILPFPHEETLPLLKKCKKIVAVENNYTAQFAGVIREHTGIEIRDRLLKYDGRPFYPEEIADKMRQVK